MRFETTFSKQSGSTCLDLAYRQFTKTYNLFTTKKCCLQYMVISQDSLSFSPNTEATWRHGQSFGSPRWPRQFQSAWNIGGTVGLEGNDHDAMNDPCNIELFFIKYMMSDVRGYQPVPGENQHVITSHSWNGILKTGCKLAASHLQLCRCAAALISVKGGAGAHGALKGGSPARDRCLAHQRRMKRKMRVAATNFSYGGYGKCSCRDQHSYLPKIE